MQVDDVIGNTHSVYEIDDNYDSSSELAIAYARYKLGEVDVRRRFLLALAQLVSGRIGGELQTKTNDWVIVTPATTELAFEFAMHLQESLQLKNPLPVQIVGPDPCPGSDYTDCSTEQRNAIVSSFYDFSADLTGKRILLIDDLLNTGTAIRELCQRLVMAGADPLQIHAFVFVRGLFSDPKREAHLVRSVIERMSLEGILAILAHPDHYLTSANMLKYLSDRGSRDLHVIVNALSKHALERLQHGLLRYYRNHPIPSRMQLLLDSPLIRTSYEGTSDVQ